MAGINQVIAGNKASRADYTRRQREVRATFKNKLPRGSLAKCGRDLMMAPGSVGTVVAGKRMSVATLTLVEAWLVETLKRMEQEAPQEA